MDIIFTPDFDIPDTFFDINPKALPDDANYYFNVLIKSVALRPGDMELPSIQGIDDLWYLEHITDKRPWIAHFYVDDSTESDDIVEEYPHCVVEVRTNGDVCWYDMIDWETEDRWALWDGEEDDDYEPILY